MKGQAQTKNWHTSSIDTFLWSTAGKHFINFMETKIFQTLKDEVERPLIVKKIMWKKLVYKS